MTPKLRRAWLVVGIIATGFAVLLEVAAWSQGLIFALGFHGVVLAAAGFFWAIITITNREL